MNENNINQEMAEKLPPEEQYEKVFPEEFPVEDEEPQQIQPEYSKEQIDTSIEEEPVLEPSPINNEYKKYKLLDLFFALKKYIEIFKESFKNVEYDVINDMQIKRINNAYDELNITYDNILFYTNNVFEYDDYNKNLYTYLLYNKKVSEIISSFRNILRLNYLNNEEKK